MNLISYCASLLAGTLGFFFMLAPVQAEESPDTESGLLTIDHYFQLASVSDPQISPEGDWIAYAVSRQDLEEDSWMSQIWMVRASGG